MYTYIKRNRESSMTDDKTIIELSEFKPKVTELPVGTMFSMKYPPYTLEQPNYNEVKLLKIEVAKLQEQVYDGYKRIIELNAELHELKSKYENKE